MIPDQVFQLSAFASNLENALDDGGRAIAYRRDDESGEMVLVLWHYDGSEEHLYPSVLDEFQAWLRTLPNKEPEQ